jgi:hypothetical protein
MLAILAILAGVTWSGARASRKGCKGKKSSSDRQDSKGKSRNSDRSQVVHFFLAKASQLGAEERLAGTIIHALDKYNTR